MEKYSDRILGTLGMRKGWDMEKGLDDCIGGLEAERVWDYCRKVRGET